MKTHSPGGAKTLAVYDAASNCLSLPYYLNKNHNDYILKLRKRISSYVFRISLHLHCVAFSNAQNRPPFEITMLCTYLLLITMASMATCGEHVMYVEPSLLLSMLIVTGCST